MSNSDCRAKQKGSVHGTEPFLFTERGRFELPLGVTLNLISSQTHSTTLPPLQMGLMDRLITKRSLT